MSVQPGDTVFVRFVTRDTSGNAADASSGPTGTLIRNGDDTGEIVTITSKGTGRYRAEFTVPGSWNIGDEVELEISATVDSIDWVTIERRITLATDPAPATQQSIRDAMALSLSGGTTINSGSIDKKADDILAQTNQLVFNGGDLVVTLDGETVQLSASQPNYAPAKAGDAMDLISAVKGGNFNGNTDSLEAIRNNQFDPSQQRVQLKDVEGISDESFRKILLAFAINLNQVTDLGGGDRRVVFLARDGVAEVARVEYKTADGKRFTSVIA